MEKTDMIFFGAGGHAKVVIEAWVAGGGEVAAVYDDADSVSAILEYEVKHDYTPGDLIKNGLCISVGSNQARRKISERLKAQYHSVVHPKATIAKSATVGDGTVVMAGAVINAQSTIGKHVILNTSCVIEHDCVVNDFAHISPGAVVCGGVTIGEGTHIGAGSVVIQNVVIGPWAIVGAGSVITKDVPERAVVVGAPGRIVRYNG
jgi:sugar O-acyltransferase (sialic acid O-acetyltransferase NeuD family)